MEDGLDRSIEFVVFGLGIGESEIGDNLLVEQLAQGFAGRGHEEWEERI